MRKYISILLFGMALVVASCSKDTGVEKGPDKNVEIAFSVPEYTLQKISSRSTRATTPATDAEKEVKNLYVFLFSTTGGTTLKYYVDAAFTGGTWDSAGAKVTINQLQSVVGNRNVYVVANCADIKGKLDLVNSLTDLQNVLLETAQPWTPQITTPILMVGNQTWDFSADYQLKTIPLTRAVAKIEVNVTITTKTSQSTPTIGGIAQYKYKYVGFDKNTYVLKPATKTTAAVTSDWMNFSATATQDANTQKWTTGYVITDGKVTGLKLFTYINERDDVGSRIDLSLPFYDESGFLPPPEFGDGDQFRLELPQKVVRNTLYSYDLEL